MIFFAVTPILIGGFGNFCLPLLIGARDMAFPRLNMLSFWTMAAATGDADRVVLRAARDGRRPGWTAYATLSTAIGAPGVGQTLWVVADLPQRRLVGDGRRQLHHHRHPAARARHDLLPHAAHRVGLLPDLDPERAVRAGAGGGDGAAVLRPRVRHPVLHRRHHHPRRRRSDPLPAPVLAVRPPRGLHPDPARLGDRHRPAGLLRAQAGLRLPGHGLVADRGRDPVVRWSTATTCSRPA